MNVVRPLLVLSFLLGAGSAADAACTCACVNGKPQAQCPTTLEARPQCPQSVCTAANQNTIPAPPRSEGRNCQVVKVLNPQTHQPESQLVCK